MPRSVEGSRWVSDIHIGPDEIVTKLYYALAPEVPGTYELKTEVQYADGGAYSLNQDFYANLVVEKNANTLSGDVTAALQALTVTGQDKVKVSNAIKSLQAVMGRPVTTKTDIEQNIRDILKAADAVRTVTGTDVSSILLMIDDMLKVWESRWYYY
jgi:hypothetical protein